MAATRKIVEDGSFNTETIVGLQMFLRAHNHSIAVDGKFGAQSTRVCH
jgi:hypothetical protein